MKATVMNLHLGRAYSFTKVALAAVGFVALFGFAALPEQVEPSPAPEAGAVNKVASISPALTNPAVVEPAHTEQQALAEFIAQRWRIAESAAAHFVSVAYRAGLKYSIDPVLILAVMAVESRYNPVAESHMGAKGLMQIIPRFHPEKLVHHGGEEALLNPEVNIHVGAQILREYYRRLGDLQAALQMYAGAFFEPTSQYSAKVFAEQARLEPIRQRARKQTAQSS